LFEERRFWQSQETDTKFSSYDNEQSFTDKKRFMSGRCLSGFMIWAVDQDTPDFQALAGLIGKEMLAGSLLEGGNLDSRSASALSDAFGAYTGQNCFVTPTCTDGASGQQSSDQVQAPQGYFSLVWQDSNCVAGVPIWYDKYRNSALPVTGPWT
jgi:chitinase